MLRSPEYAFLWTSYRFGRVWHGPVTAVVSGNRTKLFTWTGAGEMPAAERARLRSIVDTAHQARQRVRFWATPDVPGQERDAIWRELVAAGVDHINTDDLKGLADFLR